MIGYHFHTGKLRDGRALPAIGDWLVHDGEIIPCQCGLHACEQPFDALQYAPGPFLDRVELIGDLVTHGEPIDKYCGRQRRRLASIDATSILRRFACDCALDVIHLWKAPEIVKEYLQTADDTKRAAAEGAARAAAEGAAWEAAWAAARAAAEGAAWAAADGAAWTAAWTAARAAAWAAAEAAQRQKFNSMIEEALPK